MIDKQIIIDGVDVSGCEYYFDGKCRCMNASIMQDFYLCPQCNSNSNCYYKQLKRTESELARKEQENKKLREDIKDIANLLDLDTGEEYNFGNIELEIKQLKAKEQECEELKTELHKNFEEKDTLHLIIDRLLEASGYDTNTASAEDFEDVYENMRYEKQQLDQLKGEQNKIKTICENHFDEYEIGCLDLSDAIESLLERYDNAITGLMKDRKELRTENEHLSEKEKEARHYLEEAKKFKKCLTEIEEIADIINDRTMVASYICDHLDKILQKINKCEVCNDMENN